MFSELNELVPAMSRVRAKKLINRSWKYVQNSCLWSFQLKQSSFSTPQVTTAGTISVAIGSDLVTGDLNATIAWNALPFYWRTTVQQIRAQGFSIYSIIAQGGNGSVAYGTVLSPGSGQPVGFNLVNILDGAGGGTGGTATVIVNSDGTVTLPPVIVTPGANYVQPYLDLSAFTGVAAQIQLFQFAVLTLDRNFTDPVPFTTGVGYQMFMQYIVAPPRFRRWFTIADMFNCWALTIWDDKRTIDLRDPARLYTSNPAMALGVGVDERGAGTATPSSTLGQQLYELYPNPQTEIGYQTYYAQEAPYLVNNTDTLPPQITEEVVVQKALTWAYRDSEARKDIMAAKGSGANFLGLKQDSEEDFLIRLKTLRLLDRDRVDAYFVKMNQALLAGGMMPYFNPISGTANMGIGGWA